MFVEWWLMTGGFNTPISPKKQYCKPSSACIRSTGYKRMNKIRSLHGGEKRTFNFVLPSRHHTMSPNYTLLIRLKAWLSQQFLYLNKRKSNITKECFPEVGSRLRRWDPTTRILQVTLVTSLNGPIGNIKLSVSQFEWAWNSPGKKLNCSSLSGP